MELSNLLARGDLDELVREVDRLAARESWDDVVALAEGCRRATEDVGKQLWGVAHYADYRLALEAPPELAASVVVPGAGRFGLGPLTEVVAQHHTFTELAEHLAAAVMGPVAHERVIRGEDLSGDPRIPADELGPSLRLEPWEPVYAIPRYRANDRLDGMPAELPPGRRVVDAAPAEGRARVDVERGLRGLVEAWERESAAVVTTTSVTGSAEAAVASLVRPDGISPPVELVRLDVTQAFCEMATAGASGGVHGRRRGGAAGRSGAWWVGVLATGSSLPVDPDELEFGLEELVFHALVTDRPAGYSFGLVIEDPHAGWAAAIDAYDALDEEGD